MLLRTYIPLLIFCLFALHIMDKGVVKYLHITVYLSVSSHHPHSEKLGGIPRRKAKENVWTCLRL